MKCEEAETNLSLYVAGDIEEHGARERIAAHLEGCDACRSLAAEWEASQHLLHLQQPPEFDAAFFDAVRRNVMSRISEPRPSLFARLLGQPFGQRTLTYAAAFSLLVCAVILSTHFLRRAQTPTIEVAKEDKSDAGKVKTDNTKESGSQAHEGATKGHDIITAPQPQSNTPPQRGVRQAVVALKRAVRRVEKLTTPPQARDSEQVAHASSAQSVNAVPDRLEPKRVETAAADREMFRIELQTKDPNVRIIWLSPRTTDSDSSNKTDNR